MRFSTLSLTVLAVVASTSALVVDTRGNEGYGKGNGYGGGGSYGHGGGYGVDKRGDGYGGHGYGGGGYGNHGKRGGGDGYGRGSGYGHDGGHGYGNDHGYNKRGDGGDGNGYGHGNGGHNGGYGHGNGHGHSGATVMVMAMDTTGATETTTREVMEATVDIAMAMAEVMMAMVTVMEEVPVMDTEAATTRRIEGITEKDLLLKNAERCHKHTRRLSWPLIHRSSVLPQQQASGLLRFHPTAVASLSRDTTKYMTKINPDLILGANIGLAGVRCTIVIIKKKKDITKAMYLMY
ncbi:hypothetical protein CPB84DRAFT_1879371 [Gymnopilus junonius]|uniref:Uncharacterized protein n=1 Tax=Gymnopilus junonius TaxID=109634 RepID=A0A9P5NDW0_GYMJU|nr:hypothetical protein CPB84DRAFT_1879371 [Gymnopilus junonius]